MGGKMENVLFFNSKILSVALKKMDSHKISMSQMSANVLCALGNSEISEV